ncbi:MAG: ComF family protein [Bradymonadaceae bacterium]|nr:ComF family protein [Lujinxingiaceae bacterium]
MPQLKTLFSASIEAAARLVFPPRCLGCERYLDAHQTLACDACRPTIYRLSGPACPSCALPRNDLPGRPSPGVDELCSSCLELPPGFERSFAFYEYEGVIAEALQHVKYAGALHKLAPIAREMRPWLLQILEQLSLEADALSLVPVPMHLSDLRRRGFNAPSLMLRELLHKSRWQIDDHIAFKRRPSAAQAGLSRGERQNNVRDIFGVRADRPARAIAVIFDDVMTTGSTASELALALRQAGYARVVVVVVARAIGY